MQFAISARQKIADGIRSRARQASGRALSLGCNILFESTLTRRVHIRKTRVGLIAFGREADIIELDFIGAAGGHKLCQRQVVILHRGVRRIGPNQLAVLSPGLRTFAIGRFQRAR